MKFRFLLTMLATRVSSSKTQGSGNTLFVNWNLASSHRLSRSLTPTPEKALGNLVTWSHWISHELEQNNSLKPILAVNGSKNRPLVNGEAYC
jgi:hypothetical protein